MPPTLHAYRRSVAIGLVWSAAMVGLVATSPSASSQVPVDPGLGNAYAQGIRVDPRSGRLSFGITYGMALAGHQNTVAVAESRSVDLGLIGVTLAAEPCSGGDPTLPKEDQPQPLVARSTEDGAGEGRAETENAVEKRVRATDQPFAEAVAVTAAAGDPAAVQLGATSSRTVSGIVDGTRQARAVTEVSRIAFAGGAVVLDGLRWDALWQSAPKEVVEGAFTIEGVEIGGQSVALPAGDLSAALAEVNAVLQPLGFSIDPPAVREEAGISFVDPLRISIVPSDTRETLLGPVFTGVQPVRESLFDAIVEAECRSASVLTVADVVLGSVSGAGSLNLEVGGVTARSSDLETTSFLGGVPGGGSLGPLPTVPAGSGGSSSTGPSLAGAGSGTTGGFGGGAGDEPGGERADAEDVALPAVDRAAGSRGGPLVGVGLAGLLLLAALAEGDRRKMRRAQRSVLVEDMT